MSVEELLSIPGLDAVMVETKELSLVRIGQNVSTEEYIFT